MRKPKFLLIAILVLQFFVLPQTATAATTTVLTETTLTPSITGVGNIWTGKVPTKVSFPTSSYCTNLEFSIQGLLPISILADRALGVSVEFELWSAAGAKTAYDTIYSSSWNPTGPNTAVSISLPYQCAGTFTMIVRTIYETKTDGLLTSYLKDEKRLPVELIGGGTQTSNVASVQASKPYTANIAAIGDIWSAAIPSAVTLVDGSYSSYLEFQVTALQPYADLANRSTGTSIEFEIWDTSGKQVASDTLSAYDWNPIASNTLASIYLGSDVNPGTYSFVFRTIYRTSSDGLLSRYLKAESNGTLTIAGKTRPKAITPQIISSIEYTSAITGVGNIWSASLPKLIQLPDSSSSKLEFNIKGLLPVSVLTDRALGVEVDFEIWSESGVKITNDTIYSSDWNAKGSDTLVSMYMFPDRFNEPAILRVVTTYSTRTNGLLSNYLEDVDNFQITVRGASAASTETSKTTAETPFVANIKQVGDIWRGSIPTEVDFSKSRYLRRINFQVEGLVPYSVLADKSLGVSVEFELWSDAGEKIGYDTIYTSEWNPVGPKTLVDLYIYSDLVADTYTLLIRTIYETNTNGLLSGYWEEKRSQKLKITGAPTTLPAGHAIVETRAVTSNISGVGNIWSGNIPTKVALNPDADSSQISFQIQSILPYSTLADRSTGTNIEIEIWSAGGEKVTYEDVSAYDWSPIGVKTLAKLYIWSSDMKPGTYSMIVRTIYKTKSNGLLSNYLKDEKTFPFTIVETGRITEFTSFQDVNLSQKKIADITGKFYSTNKVKPIVVTSSTPTVCSISGADLQFKTKGTCSLVANQKGADLLYDSPARTVTFEIVTAPPAKIDTFKASWVNDGIEVSWVAPASDEPITEYEIGFSTTQGPDLLATSGDSYFDYIPFITTSDTKFTITAQQLYDYYLYNASSQFKGIHLRLAVRATSGSGTSEFWNWYYFTFDDLSKRFWSKYSPALELTISYIDDKENYVALNSPTSEVGLTGIATSYSWRFSVAPEGSDFANYSYSKKGTEFATTTSNSINANALYSALGKYKSSFPDKGAVLIFVVGKSAGKESLDPNNLGLYISTDEAYKVIDDANAAIAAEAKAAAELKAKQEAEAKAAAELKAKQEAEAKAAAELKAKQEAEAKAKAAAELKAKQEAEAQAAAELKAKQDSEAKAAAEAKAKQDAEAKAAAAKKTSITCVKGKLTKKVTAVKPKCPAGYKIKR